MIERDYIMRMVQMLASALARILLRRDLKRYDEALEEISNTAERLIGMKWGFFRGLTVQEITELLSYDRKRDKMLAAAELLREESEVLLERGEVAESNRQALKALSLYLELILGERSFLKVMSVVKFEHLMKRLDEGEMPLPLRRKQFRYYEVTGVFGRAEDVLFEIIAEDPSFSAEGISFYRRLLEASDEELRRGGLPRSEVAEGLAKLSGRGG